MSENMKSETLAGDVAMPEVWAGRLGESLVKRSDALAALAAKNAEIAKLNQDADEMRQTMAAAAEEIHEHWSAHCDKEGYGPVNLQRRLEGPYGVNYPGYTLGAFERLTAERDKLAARVEAPIMADFKFLLEHERRQAWCHFVGAPLWLRIWRALTCR